MITEKLTLEEKQILLDQARLALNACVRGTTLPLLDQSKLTPILRANGASFVTLTIYDELRGCIGALQPYQPLVEDVREHAIAAALEDYRFPQVKESELSRIQVEVSRLTIPIPLDYQDADDLITKLRPGIDGIIIKDDFRRATFLPQVWEKIPEAKAFLANLCIKMGVQSDTWKRKHLEVSIYEVEEFHE